MKTFILSLFLFNFCTICLLKCNGQKSNKSPNDKTNHLVKSSRIDTIAIFIDSVKNIPLSNLLKNVGTYPDSIFNLITPINETISKRDLKNLKLACSDNEWYTSLNEFYEDSNFVFFENKELLKLYEGRNGELKYYKFANNEFAISVDISKSELWDCAIYFFKGNKLVAKQNVHHHYGLELEYYVANDGHSVVYYKEIYAHGSGLWWFNYYFYKYTNDAVVPYLDVVQNINQQWGGARNLVFESKIINTNPLTFKMVYYQELASSFDYAYKVVNDSTTITYTWNAKTKLLQPNFTNTKLSAEKIATFYLEDNDLLFIKEYNNELKAALKDSSQQKAVLEYISGLKEFGYGK